MSEFGYKNIWGMTTEQRLQERRRSASEVISVGSEIKPDPPRELIAQSGSRKAVLTWRLPVRDTGIVGWRIWKDNEKNLVQEIHDKFTTQAEVGLSAGSNPPDTNIFLASINAQGVESVKVITQIKAAVEAGAPPDPVTPPTYVPPDSTRGRQPCFTPDTEVKTVEGSLRFDQLREGMIAIVDGKERRIRKVLVHDYDGWLYRVTGTEWGVTPEHKFRSDGWKSAKDLFRNIFHYVGKVFNLEMDAEDFDDKCYELGNGLVAHNMKAFD